jgi:chorismate dehydratase
MLIGDRAIREQSDKYPLQWDLGEQWVRQYQAPFVFAVWTARRGVELGDLPWALSAARDAGIANLPQIAVAECQHVGLTQPACLAYLRDNLYFRFGDEQRRGLDLFRARAAHYDFLIPATAAPPEPTT